jgi:hypothetical protein
VGYRQSHPGLNKNERIENKAIKLLSVLGGGIFVFYALSSLKMINDITTQLFLSDR